MKLNKLIKERRFDKRIVDWGLRYKMINAEEYQKHLKSLPDLSDQKEDMQGLQEKNTKTPRSKAIASSADRDSQTEAMPSNSLPNSMEEADSTKKEQGGSAS